MWFLLFCTNADSCEAEIDSCGLIIYIIITIHKPRYLDVLVTPYITADTCNVEKQVSYILGELYFIFANIIQSLLKFALIQIIFIYSLVFLIKKEVMNQVSKLYAVCMCIL